MLVVAGSWLRQPVAGLAGHTQHGEHGCVLLRELKARSVEGWTAGHIVHGWANFKNVHVYRMWWITCSKVASKRAKPRMHPPRRASSMAFRTNSSASSATLTMATCEHTTK